MWLKLLRSNMTAKNDKPIGDQSDRNAEDRAMLRRIEAELAVEKLRAQKSASELAGEHLGMWGRRLFMRISDRLFRIDTFLAERCDLSRHGRCDSHRHIHDTTAQASGRR